MSVCRLSFSHCEHSLLRCSSRYCILRQTQHHVVRQITTHSRPRNVTLTYYEQLLFPQRHPHNRHRLPTMLFYWRICLLRHKSRWRRTHQCCQRRLRNERPMPKLRSIRRHERGREVVVAPGLHRSGMEESELSRERVRHGRVRRRQRASIQLRERKLGVREEELLQYELKIVYACCDSGEGGCCIHKRVCIGIHDFRCNSKFKFGSCIHY